MSAFSLTSSVPAAISCGDPGVPPNTAVSGSHSWTYGSVIQYSCLHGGVLVGNVSRHCQEDGTWSGAPPYCTGECKLADRFPFDGSHFGWNWQCMRCHQRNVSWSLHVLRAIMERARWTISSSATSSRRWWSSRSQYKNNKCKKHTSFVTATKRKWGG